MDFFERYTSNTYAGSSNQLIFGTDGKINVGRVFYKISVGGKYSYSILFSNTIDSTYADGRVSQKNLACKPWTLHGARVGRCSRLDESKDVWSLEMDKDIEIVDFVDLTFEGERTKNVKTAELFCCDEFEYSFKKGDYLCLEITYSGDLMPYHEESLLPVYVKDEDGWKYSKKMPFAQMIGCDRQVEKRVAYLGDSITQGIGVPHNKYTFWNALVSEAWGEQNAYWNLGIGFGRANDGASDGVWLYKAKQNDIVVVCFGVNDICQGMSSEQIKSDLLKIVEALNEAGCKVILQTIPPFDYDEEKRARWIEVNEYIKLTLSKRALLVFDVVPYLSKNEQEPQMAKFGGHPNEEGSAVWARVLFEAIEKSGLK